MRAMFTIAVFLAAALLFGVQPMVAKALLPAFGGGASVWTTCMLFFQTLLIAGYLYAHLLMKLPRPAQLGVHGVVIALALVIGWFADAPTPPTTTSGFPVPWLLWQLTLLAGLPYFAVSSAGPLLQGWFARTGHARAHDPYFLYAASNAGSLLGLMAYPLVIEPTLGLRVQWTAWLALFALFGVLALGCSTRARAGHTQPDHAHARSDPAPITGRRRLGWIFLAFVPSSMLLATTTHLSAEVASFPLLWVVPLAVYLLTMIIAFSGGARPIARVMARPMILAVVSAWVLLVAWDLAALSVPVGANIAVQLLLLASVGLVGHARLAGDRPPASNLTEYYLLLSVGGALGGLFNSIIAPLVFPDVFEYHATLLLALAMLPVGVSVTRSRRVLVAAVSMSAVMAAIAIGPSVANDSARLVMLVLPCALLVYMSWRDRWSCVLAFAPPLLSAVVAGVIDPGVDHRERTFFGVHRVVRNTQGETTFRRLIHGTTLHGLEKIQGPGPQGVPLGYYHPRGPLGGLMRSLHETIRQTDGQPRGIRVGVVGLGTGAIAAYSQPDDDFVFYEIDPAVVRIASDPDSFGYLTRALGQVRVEIGDGRRLLEQSPSRAPFDALLIDAFSSDAIPTHLLTTEAVGLYRDRISEDGVVVLHISNRHLDLSGLVFAIADQLGLIALINDDGVDQEYTERTGHFASTWVALTASGERADLLRRQGFSDPRDNPEDRPRPWTDDASNLLSVWGTD